ncbi:response regulator [Xylophilus rhododendri]|uniref:Response regulator n=1 Tax=Xylophilus rhododendri TaxID=2697032 RepID=A0A857J1B2_9BURK|nr:response regulator [Xylophilus rhododendri]QHI96882.1 response regulator [Xylophilus rhododendri]
MRLMLVEDDPGLRAALARTLLRRGFEVVEHGDGRQALDAWAAEPPDILVLDLSLPGLDGLEVLAAGRRRGLLTPVLLLTARATVGDRVMGLNAGADDYLPKPFDLDELEARIRAIARRRAPAGGGQGGNSAADADPGVYQAGSLRYEKFSGAIYCRGEPMELAPRELALLQALILQPGRAVAKERLFELVFPGETEVQYEAIEVVAYRLRKKLSGTGTALMTLRGLGYLLKLEG